MDITLLIQLFFILIFLLAVLIFFLLRRAKAKKLKREEAKTPLKKVKVVDLDTLRDRLKNKKLKSDELKEILDLVIADHGVINDFKVYSEIILRMTLHPAANKDIVISFDRELSKLNPTYASLISDQVTKGLSAR